MYYFMSSQSNLVFKFKDLKYIIKISGPVEVNRKVHIDDNGVNTQAVNGQLMYEYIYRLHKTQKCTFQEKDSQAQSPGECSSACTL